MNILKRLTIISIIMILLITMISGCKDGKKEPKSKGRYVEEEYKFIDGITYLLDIKVMNNGKMALLGQINDESKDGFTIDKTRYYESIDNGQNWTEKEVNLPSKIDDKFLYYEQGEILDDGSFVFIVSEYTQEDIDEINKKMQSLEEETNISEEYAEEEYDQSIYSSSVSKLVRIDRKGNITEIHDDNINISDIGILGEENGYLYLNNYDEPNIIQVDINENKVIRVIKTEGDYIGEAIILNNRIYVNNYDNVIEYNAEDGSKIGKDNMLSKNTMSNLTYAISSDKKTLYQAGEDGVYSYSIGNKINEQLIDGSMTAFGDDDYIIDKFLETADNQFLALFYNSSGNKTIMKHYYYDKDVDSKPDKELMVYSLYEDSDLKQNIVKYQKENSDVYINYEIGIDTNGNEDDMISESDAIKTLNTEIMAGKGPDIIYLDGLQENSYIDKGLLVDLSDVANSFKDKEYLTKILKGSSVNGKIYSLSMYFRIPVIFNNTNKNVSNLNELAEAVSEVKGSYKGDIVLPIEADEMLYYFYKTCGVGILNEDGTLNEEKLKEYLEDVRIIYVASKDNHLASTIKEHEEMLESYDKYSAETEESFAKSMYSDNYLNWDVTSGLDEVPAFSICTLYSTQDVVTYNKIIQEYPSLNYSKWLGLDNKSIMNWGKIGISSKSKEQELAKHFIKTLFSEKYQKNSRDSMNFSVNKKILKKSLQDEETLSGTMEWISQDENENVCIDMLPLTDEEVNKFIEMINSYGGAKDADTRIIDDTIEDMVSYVKGEKSMDETLAIINNKLKVYLSE